jgi:trehalose synthase-fused probable maltokinase
MAWIGSKETNMSFGDRAGDAVRQSAAWITSQRWYGDKARSMMSLRPETIVPVDVGPVDAALVIVCFSYDRGPDARYFVPLASSAGKQMPNTGVSLDVRDAFTDPSFLAWFLAGFDERRAIGDGDAWRWRPLGGDMPPLSTLNFAKARMISAEQSNSTVVFDDRIIGKVFRRLQAGINPDLEIGEFLSSHGGFANAPKLFGVVEVVQDDEVTAIAAIQQYIPNQGDGWQWLLGALDALNPGNRDHSLDAVALLGTRTGELHVALASGTEASFAPEPFTPQDAQELNQRIVAEMSESVEGLAKHVSPDEVAAIHRGIGQLMGTTNALLGSHKVRIHGDYHLGQTLRTLDDDFVLIDFEGEPARSIAQRRVKQTALKDVAGMVRSLDYAVATVRERTDDAGQRDALDRWLTDAQEAFLAAYREAAAGAAQPIVPDDDQRFDEGLRLMVAEKALYEVRYELNNRPAWLPIPLNGLRRLMGLPVSR